MRIRRMFAVWFSLSVRLVMRMCYVCLCVLSFVVVYCGMSLECRYVYVCVHKCFVVWVSLCVNLFFLFVACFVFLMLLGWCCFVYV